jgi:hypothetical protein
MKLFFQIRLRNEVDNSTQELEPEKELDGTETVNPDEEYDPTDDDFFN